ncbi:protein maelstrom homolog [Cimex lectularius]|uniref:Protein maelstrom homolog n=1 Tax=Cimex lectularius TaxID=79782 RepID=A0A8I6SFZ5_CIMLE|nr:protein maelstrom homolog [Cimex lectularius]XP_024082212.1 protein maelstrom homolog [Cimex lectularius]XP_024082213.1 protein maelstrom homolog [Cimex lectularius]
MAPKKKTIRNGFYYFMLDVQADEERKGRTFANKKEVADYAGPLWEALAPDQKAEYNQKAKGVKNSTKEITNKFTSLGISFAAQMAEEREADEKYQIMKQTIRNTVKSLNSSSIKTFPFYFCHVNFTYKTDDFYAPAEIAVVEFTLGDGLLNKFHCFINPGKVPMGLRFEALDWSEKTHSIPLNWSEGETDHFLIFNKLINFLTRNHTADSVPPIYTMPDSLNSNTSLNAVKSAMSLLCAAGQNDPELLRVYSLPQLFFELRNKVVENTSEAPMPSLAIVENEIEKDVFGGLKNLACKFHEEKDLAMMCSLSIVTRWVYTLCDHCCKFIGVELEVGKHVANEVDTTWSIQNSRHSKTPKPKEEYEAEEPDEESNKAKNISFMPTIIDHSQLKAKREQERIEQEELNAINEEIRPPTSLTVFNIPNTSDGFISDPNDFPEIGGTRMVGVQRDTPVWPVSGRGWGKRNIKYN